MSQLWGYWDRKMERGWDFESLGWLLCSLSFVTGKIHDRLIVLATAAAKSLQSCPTLCDPIDGSPPGSPVPGILQARTLEWVATSFSNAWKWKVKVKSLSRVQLSTTPWTAAHQAPPSMGFPRQEYWSGLPFPSPGDFPNPGTGREILYHWATREAQLKNALLLKMLTIIWVFSDSSSFSW